MESRMPNTASVFTVSFFSFPETTIHVTPIARMAGRTRMTVVRAGALAGDTMISINKASDSISMGSFSGPQLKEIVVLLIV